MRSLLAAALPLVAEPLFDNVGVHWACTLLGCLAILFAGVPFLFYFYGARYVLRRLERDARLLMLLF